MIPVKNRNAINMEKQFKNLLAVVLIFGFFGSIQRTKAQSCFAGWDYYQVFSYTNNSGQTIADIQVPIEMNTNALVMQGKLNPDGSDLRICGMSCNPFHFYADSAMDASTNIIWVKLPYVANGSTTEILVYYGNSSMTTGVANGDSTFIFFDDFEDNNIDYTKWETFGTYGYLEETSGSLQFESTSWEPDSRWKYVKTTSSFQQQVSIDIGEYHDNNHLFGYAMADVPLTRLYQRPISNSNDTLRMITITDTTSNGYYSPGSMDFPFISVGMSQWNDLSINILPVPGGLQFNSFVNMTGGTSAVGPYTIAVPGIMTAPAFHVCLSSFTMQGNPVGLSYIKVRNGYHDISPLTPGAEQMNLFTSSHADLSRYVSVYPNPATDQITVRNTIGENGLMRIMDANGRMVLSQNSNSIMSVLDVSSLTPGVYNMQISNSRGMLNHTFIKQ